MSRIGLPARFVEHGARSELLKSCGLDAFGVARQAREMIKKSVGKSQQRKVGTSR